MKRRKPDCAAGQMALAFVQQPITLALRLRSYWEAATRREGYARPEDAIVGIYRETGSTAETARRLTFSRQCISNHLKDLHEPTKGPGGANNPYGRAGKHAQTRNARLTSAASGGKTPTRCP